jgi:hypothetical protein
LAVQEFINQIYDNTLDIDFNKILNKLRDLAKGIRRSTLRWEMLQDACKALDFKPSTIPIDIKVHWNSMLHMIEASIYMRKPITRFLFELVNGSDINESNTTFYDRCHMSDQEWDLAEVLYVFLLPFKRVTPRFESNKHNPEIDYMFFAYDRMFNHIEDVLYSLRRSDALGSLECAPTFITALEKMKAKLQEYYDKTKIPFVYADAMILNPCCKLSIFSEETWADLDPKEYSDQCRERFQLEYLTVNASSSHGIKRSAPNDDDYDDEFQAHLAERAAKRPCITHDYDRYINEPNDPMIKSALGWWRVNYPSYTDLGMMARNTLAVPASGSSVERVFSIAGRVATWQRSRLHDSTIVDIMMYKAVMNLEEMALESEGEEDLPVPEMLGKVPVEWEQDWWKKKLRHEIRPEDMRRFMVDDE